MIAETPFDQETINQLGIFVRRIRDFDIEISKVAKHVERPALPSLKNDKTTDLTTNLVEAMNQYDFTKVADKVTRYKTCSIALMEVNYAQAHGYIQPSEGIFTKLSLSQAKVAELEQQVMELKKEIRSLHESHQKVGDDLIDVQGQLKNCKDFVDKHMSALKAGDSRSDDELV